MHLSEEEIHKLSSQNELHSKPEMFGNQSAEILDALLGSATPSFGEQHEEFSFACHN